MADGMTERRDDEVNLLDFAVVLLQRKSFIAKTTFTAVIIAVIASLMMPKVFRAETRILPPRETGGVSPQLLNQLGTGIGGLAGMVAGDSQADLYVGLLQSRTILDSMVAKFDLKNRYSTKNGEDARRRLSGNIRVEADPKSGLVTLSVEDRDPQRAADMANAFIEELRNMTTGLAVTEAAQRRLFFEEQLRGAKQALVKAEEGIKGFQEKTGALHGDEQIKAVIRGVAQLRAEIAAKEVEIKVMRTYSMPNNPDLQKAVDAARAMKAELAKLESGNAGGGYDPLMPTGRLPSVGTEYVRKLRDLKFNETLYELLVKQYEAAKLDEARDAAVIQVVDRAVKPEKRAKPKRTVLVAITGTVALFLSGLTALLLDYRDRLAADPVTGRKMALLKRHLPRLTRADRGTGAGHSERSDL